MILTGKGLVSFSPLEGLTKVSRGELSLSIIVNSLRIAESSGLNSELSFKSLSILFLSPTIELFKNTYKVSLIMVSGTQNCR